MVKLLRARLKSSRRHEEVQVLDPRESASARLHRAYKAAERGGADSLGSSTRAAPPAGSGTGGGGTGGGGTAHPREVVPVTAGATGREPNVTLTPLPAAPLPGARPATAASDGGGEGGGATPLETSAARLIFYERLFFMLDLANDQEGEQLFVEFEDVDRFLSFVR